ncbi:MAG: A/G-specific adenine glycosylase, partial [Opitutaceae bacterium]
MNGHARTLTASKKRFRADLAAWFEREQRLLPWRTDRSLYRTVVSELMLQQTQIATVLPYFERWMRDLPDFAALAAASEAKALKLWEGLGYYRRVRFLHRLARELVDLPEPPRTAAGWLPLPGVGAYTAAAIASISFDDRAACVDGNVVRILARLTGETKAFPDSSQAVRHFQSLAAELLDPHHPGRHNEAMMELGATVCVRRAPRCEACPVARLCAARRIGTAERLPRIARAAVTKQEVDRAWVVRDGKLLLHEAGDARGRLHGLLELPLLTHLGHARTTVGERDLLATHRRAITRYKITERIYRVRFDETQHGDGSSLLCWVPIEQLPAITLSGPHRRWIALA